MTGYQDMNNAPRRGGVRRLLRAAGDAILAVGESRQTVSPTADALHLDVVGVLGVTPFAYGLDLTREAPRWHILRHQNGWGKAEAEEASARLGLARLRTATEGDSSWLEAA